MYRFGYSFRMEPFSTINARILNKEVLGDFYILSPIRSYLVSCISISSILPFMEVIRFACSSRYLNNLRRQRWTTTAAIHCALLVASWLNAETMVTHACCVWWRVFNRDYCIASYGIASQSQQEGHWLNQFIQFFFCLVLGSPLPSCFACKPETREH